MTFFCDHHEINVVLGAELKQKLLRLRGMDIHFKSRYFLLRSAFCGFAFKVDEVEPSISEMAKIDPKPCRSGCFCYCG